VARHVQGHVGVAAADGQCVGIARWIVLADEPGTAEVGVTVSTATRAAASGACWSTPCGRPPSAPV
jgi:hypothetical protein